MVQVQYKQEKWLHDLVISSPSFRVSCFISSPQPLQQGGEQRKSAKSCGELVKMKVENIKMSHKLPLLNLWNTTHPSRFSKKMYFYFLTSVLKIFSNCGKYRRRTWGPWGPGLKIWRWFSCFTKNNFSFTTVFVVCWLCAWANLDTWEVDKFAVVIVLGTSGRLGKPLLCFGIFMSRIWGVNTNVIIIWTQGSNFFEYCSFVLFWWFFFFS